MGWADHLTSTTLSDPKPSFRFFRPVHLGPTDEKQAGEDLLTERADLGKRQPWAGARATPLALEKGCKPPR